MRVREAGGNSSKQQKHQTNHKSTNNNAQGGRVAAIRRGKKKRLQLECCHSASWSEPIVGCCHHVGRNRKRESEREREHNTENKNNRRNAKSHRAQRHIVDSGHPPPAASTRRLYCNLAPMLSAACVSVCEYCLPCCHRKTNNQAEHRIRRQTNTAAHRGLHERVSQSNSQTTTQPTSSVWAPRAEARSPRAPQLKTKKEGGRCQCRSVGVLMAVPASPQAPSLYGY